LAILGAMIRLDRAVYAALCIVLIMTAMGMPATAGRKADAFALTLGNGDRAKFEAWYRSQIFFDAAMDAYWAKVEKRRRLRRVKRRKKLAFSDRDYVATYPPRYEGPTIARSLIKRWRRYRDADKPPGQRRRRKKLPGLDVYLASARKHFNFAPERIPEREFKRRYAQESLSYGLTRDQVVRVYALETGGRGTADMQAGIHPIKRTGEPISSALGYAQLLAANSINVLAKHGSSLVKRLAGLVAKEANPQRRRQLQAKLNVLRRMVRTAKSVPYNWRRHIRFSRTPRGQSLHVLNIDGDIGPWMQVVKLADLKRLAARRGHAQLSGAQIELMNLAGPVTGLEMMLPTGLNKPTTNFFSRRAYYRNTVVRGKNSSGLLKALEGRMRASIKNKGAQEFLAVFDELQQRRSKAKGAEPGPRSFGFMPYAFRPEN
jgi:hypothetical protein